MGFWPVGWREFRQSVFLVKRPIGRKRPRKQIFHSLIDTPNPYCLPVFPWNDDPGWLSSTLAKYASMKSVGWSKWSRKNYFSVGEDKRWKYYNKKERTNKYTDGLHADEGSFLWQYKITTTRYVIFNICNNAISLLAIPTHTFNRAWRKDHFFISNHICILKSYLIVFKLLYIQNKSNSLFITRLAKHSC